MAENDIIQSRSIVGKLMSSSLRIQCEKRGEEEAPRCSGHLSKYGVDTARMHRRAKEETLCLNVCLLRTGHRTFHAADFFPTCRLWRCRYGLVSGYRDGAAPAVRHPAAALPRSRERRDAGRNITAPALYSHTAHARLMWT